MKKSYCCGLNKCSFTGDKCWGMVINYGHGLWQNLSVELAKRSRDLAMK